MRLTKNRITILLLILSFLGFLDATYLTITHYLKTIPPCSILSGCEFVVTSQFSTIFGIPLALLGAIYFFALFYLSIAILTSQNKLFSKILNKLAYFGLLISLFLFLLQALIIKAYCQYCIFSEIVILFIFVFSLRIVKINK